MQEMSVVMPTYTVLWIMKVCDFWTLHECVSGVYPNACCDLPYACAPFDLPLAHHYTRCKTNLYLGAMP